jgi:hypothetical protein
MTQRGRTHDACLFKVEDVEEIGQARVDGHPRPHHAQLDVGCLYAVRANTDESSPQVCAPLQNCKGFARALSGHDHTWPIRLDMLTISRTPSGLGSRRLYENVNVRESRRCGSFSCAGQDGTGWGIGHGASAVI